MRVEGTQPTDMLSDNIDAKDEAPMETFSQNTSTNLEQKHLGSMTLLEEDKKRIYRPWKYSIIVKVIGKKINHMYLKTRLKMLLKTSEELLLIDLQHDYYIAKFFKE